jgi:UDP-glucose 4-epimerase
MGEVIGPGVFTLRTSLIGRELQRRKSLMDWFLSQWPGPVKGFKRAIFSGFTTLETTRIVQLVLEKGPDEGGLWHVSSEPVDKYTLLRMIKQEFGFDIEIKPDENVVIDRSLNSARFREQFNYSPPSWKEMIADYFTHVQNAPAGLYEPYGKKRNEDAVAPETRDNASRKKTSTMPARARKSDYLSGKTVLVTGGTGSMGRTFVHRTLSGEMGVPKKVIVFSRDEAKQHAMRMAYQNRIAATDETIYDNFRNTLEFRIGDLRSYADVCAAVKDADIVINAAAMKQVPSCEYFPVQAVSTNCLGAENIVRAVRENGYGVQTVVGISTDKACKPVNAMGMTKALQERIFISANLSCPDTRFIAVRYGNVLASRGSVIPLFHEQIRNGGPVTITVPEMTRFLMSIDQAVDTVFAALEDAKRGEIYIPIAPAATVLNTARAMIGERDIPIKVIGVRPGEKMHEILISEEESSRSIGRGDYFVIQPMLPELKGGQARSSKVPGHEFSSADTVLDPEGTRSLLAKHGLLGDTALRNVFGEMVA